MKALVVYESHWGNTEAVARAIATGIGPAAQALTTDEATEAAVLEADLIVAGAPVIGLGLASEKARPGIAARSSDASSPADLAHPFMRTWLDGLPHGHGRSAAFETGVRWSPGGATGAIDRGLARAGFRSVVRGRRFVVTGMFGPLRDGELDRAREWGAALAREMGYVAQEIR